MSILSGKSNQFQLPFIYLTVWEEPYLHRTSPKMKSIKWKISSHWETEPICCSYRTEDGQKRQEKGKVCWRKPSKILFSNLFPDQFWQNGDQRRVGVCWQRRSSLQGETHQLLGSIDHRWFSCLFLGGIDHWCLSYLFLGFINHRCFSCIFLGFIAFFLVSLIIGAFQDGVHRRRAGLSTGWGAHTSGVCPGLNNRNLKR